MDAIDLQQVYNHFCYVEQESAFYNKFSKRKVKESSVRQRIVEMYPGLKNNGTVVDKAIDYLKQFSYVPEQMRSEKKTKKEIEAEVYTEGSNYIPIRWFASVSGDSRLYYVNADREVTFGGENNFQNFSNIIRASSYLERYKQMYDAQRNSEENGRAFSRIGFEDFLRMLYEEFKFDPNFKLEKEPPIITHDPEELAYARFNPALLREGETPTWDQFLERINFPEIFMAWVWTVFEPKNKSRQALWLHGRGNDGKSSAITALTRILGEKHCMPVEESTGSQFFFSSLYGKRLATFGDCKSPRFLAGSKIHSMIGGDYVSIERKGEQPFNGYMHVRLIVGSNLFPQIDFSMTNETTRLLLLKVKQPEEVDYSIDFVTELVREKWEFLYKCREAYNKYCKNHYQIKPPKELIAEMELDASSEESNFVTDFISTHLDMHDADKYLRVNTLDDYFQEMARARGFQSNKLQRLKRDLLTRLYNDYEIAKERHDFGKTKDGKRDRAYAYKGLQIVRGGEE